MIEGSLTLSSNYASIIVILSIIDGTFYWGDGISSRNSDNSFYATSNSELHDSECDESLSVRSTALALMVYTERGEYMTEPIVRWLNSRRTAGWDSTIDTSMNDYEILIVNPIRNKDVKMD